MSTQIFGFYFSCNADKSANDYTIYVEADKEKDIKLSIRYKNAEPNSLYEIFLDTDDLEQFGQLCLDMAKNIKQQA